ncbi:MAG: hypothetical protein OEM81_04605 [Acidimicrobiia bacterium]|nr:hypothetical protein [Acidimicrobiia bacterium]MDH3397096.1 hypothetical protein [Acidimicrobiia bacterium]MDH5615439.1 hypothetical protein [Acidimicrobiia bacterium]
MTTATMTPASLEELNRKLDGLTAQVEAIANEVVIQRQRREAWVELLEDVRPITSQAFDMAVEQLDEVEEYVNLADLGHLGKRLIRNTRNLEKMLDQLESMMELIRDATPIGRSAFISLMEKLEEFDRKGYFEFAQESFGVLDEIVDSFTKEDVRALGDNIGLILQTVKEMTQPEIMGLVSRTASTVREQDIPENITLRTLIKQMRDPAVKRGLAKVLMTLRTVSGDSPGSDEAT